MTLEVARVVVVGQGYVGLPVAYAAVRAGHSVVGYEIDHDKVAALARGRSYVTDVSSNDLGEMLASGRYLPTSDPNDLSPFDVAIVTVPTPLQDGRPDLSALLAAAHTLSSRISHGALIVLESTVAPGTTSNEFVTALCAQTSLRPGEDFHVGYSPERIDPGNEKWNFRNTPKLISGIDPSSREAVHDFYRTICDEPVVCAEPAVAEMAKLLENTYRTVNIALINELARHAHAMGVPIWDVIAAASTKPYGFHPFFPGPGVGGHCLPVDPTYLSDRVERALGRSFDFIDLARRINEQQPEYVVDRVVRLLNSDGLAVSQSHILILGASYKANVGDMREAPAIRIIELLNQMGGTLAICDPHLTQAAASPAALLPSLKTVLPADAAAAARDAHLTVLLTDHDAFPYDAIAEEARRILDTRNRFASSRLNVHYL